MKCIQVPWLTALRIGGAVQVAALEAAQ